jgi:hypothetical protein
MRPAPATEDCARVQRTITPVDGSVYVKRPLASHEEVARGG